MRMRFVLIVYCMMMCMTLLSAMFMLGMCGCFPAGRTLSEEQVRQKNNEAQLRSLARRALADADGATNMCNISHDGKFLINTNQESVYISGSS